MKLRPDDIETIRERVRPVSVLRESANRAKIIVHMGTCGVASGAQTVLETFTTAVADDGAEGVVVTTSGCAGLCSCEPMATVELQGQPPVKYVNLDADKVRRIVREHVAGGEVVCDYAFGVGSERGG